MSAELSALERLERWKNGHKRRSVRINCGNGYGASCWVVHLGGVLIAPEWETVIGFEGSEPARHRHMVAVWDHDANDWPGLARVINATIDRAEDLERPFLKP